LCIRSQVCAWEFIFIKLCNLFYFTLYGDYRKGRRPSFDRSAAPQAAEDLYNRFVTKLSASGLQVQTGQFGAMMQVTIETDGPVTLLLEKEAI
jgi:D-aminoacyl-tRNA deacylase